MQIQQGTAVPVTHGTTPLQADSTLLGRRLAALIALRDHARRVLQSQNEGWPEMQRQEARRAMNHPAASCEVSPPPHAYSYGPPVWRGGCRGSLVYVLPAKLRTPPTGRLDDAGASSLFHSPVAAHMRE